MRKRNLSCSFNPPAQEVETVPVSSEVVQEETPQEDPLVSEALRLGISVGKYVAMRRYASELIRRHPNMNSKRVAQKVAQKFNVKLT